MKNLTARNTLTAVLLMSLSTLATAEPECHKDVTVATTPTSRFEILADGKEVKDSQTNLIWQHCSVGQTWDGTTCQGAPKSMTWKEALVAAQKAGNGYRLPNIKELQSLIEYQCYGPAINTQVFPMLEDAVDSYWSSTPVLKDGENAMYVYFWSGKSESMGKKSTAVVRLVRNTP